MRRIKYLKEPSAKQPKWIVVVKDPKRIDSVYYCKTKKEIKKIRIHVNLGGEMQVFKANFNFIEAWRL